MKVGYFKEERWKVEGTLSKKLLLLINNMKKHWTAKNKERQHVHAKILPFKLQIKTSSKTDTNVIINIILKLMLLYDPKGETNKQKRYKEAFLANTRNAGEKWRLGEKMGCEGRREYHKIWIACCWWHRQQCSLTPTLRTVMEEKKFQQNLKNEW